MEGAIAPRYPTGWVGTSRNRGLPRSQSAEEQRTGRIQILGRRVPGAILGEMSDEQDQPGNRPDPDDARRDEKGRFGKGNRANLSGRPKGLKEVQDRAADYTEESIRTLVTIMRRGVKKPFSAQRMSQARQAAIALLDRAWGKPAQPISGVPGQPVGIEASGEAITAFLKKIAGEE